ncbi:hypothetical protein [Vibrio lentus]|uniref:hypothetical protein n=1 Tax=Vibrio lentus TaxID=136468 RepID=UPI0010BD87C4|nr:hypothetical protein [Vibrio lentus]TKG17744.1 hypothetical protein FCW05_12620 [Vibrio lentus]
MQLETNSPVSTDEAPQDLTILNELELATDDFDVFASLDDLKVETVGDVETEDDFGKFEDETLQDENGFDLTDELDGAEADIEQRREEVLAGSLEENLEQFQAVAQRIDEMPDDMVFNLGGAEITKAELSGLAQSKELVQQQRQATDHFIRQSMEQSKVVETIIHTAKTETTKDMQRLQSILQNPATDALSLQNAMGEMRNLQGRMGQLEAEGKRYIQTRDTQLQAAKQQRLDQVSFELDKRYSHEEVGSMVSYAQSQGISKDDLFENASVPLFDALAKAQKYDALNSDAKSRVKAKATRSATPKSVKKQSVKPTANKDKIVQAWETGKHAGDSRVEDAIFGMLED